MVEIFSKSCAQFGDTNEEMFYIDVRDCYFDQCFLLTENSSEFCKKKFDNCYYYFWVDIGHLTVCCFDTLKFLMQFHMKRLENCYKISNKLMFDKANCLDIILINQKIRMCQICSNSLIFVITEQLKRIELIKDEQNKKNFRL